MVKKGISLVRIGPLSPNMVSGSIDIRVLFKDSDPPGGNVLPTNFANKSWEWITKKMISLTWVVDSSMQRGGSNNPGLQQALNGNVVFSAASRKFLLQAVDQCVPHGFVVNIRRESHLQRSIGSSAFSDWRIIPQLWFKRIWAMSCACYALWKMISYHPSKSLTQLLLTHPSSSIIMIVTLPKNFDAETLKTDQPFWWVHKATTSWRRFAPLWQRCCAVRARRRSDLGSVDRVLGKWWFCHQKFGCHMENSWICAANQNSESKSLENYWIWECKLLFLSSKWIQLAHSPALSRQTDFEPMASPCVWHPPGLRLVCLAGTGTKYDEVILG